MPAPQSNPLQPAKTNLQRPKIFSHTVSPKRHGQIRKSERLFELRKTDGSWVEIWEALKSTHTDGDCCTCWFEDCWDDFNDFFVNGEIDLEGVKEGIVKRGGASEMTDGETVVAGCTVDNGEADEGSDEMDDGRPSAWLARGNALAFPNCSESPSSPR